MKHRKFRIGVLLTTVLLLSACSGGESMVVQHNDPAEIPEIQEVPEQEQQGPVSNAEDMPVAAPVAEDGKEQTPSPPFVQGYETNPVSDRDYSEFDIVTLLPPDAIPALTNPDYYSADRADEEYEPDEMILGVEFNGDARAYSVGLLSRHEIVNDTVGGIHLAVTW